MIFIEQKKEKGVGADAAKDFSIGEEILVSYGIHYFGRNNRDCLCSWHMKKGKIILHNT